MEEYVFTANDGIILHLHEMFLCENVSASSGSDKDLSHLGSILHRNDLVAIDGGLKGVDGIYFSDNDSSALALQSLSTTFANVTITSDNSYFASNHNICGTLDTIDERFSASIQVIEFGFGDRVVDVDGGYKQAFALEHPIQVVNAGGSLFRNTIAILEHLWVFLVNKRREISTVIQDKIQVLSILECEELLLQAPFVLFLSLAFPGKAGTYNK